LRREGRPDIAYCEKQIASHPVRPLYLMRSHAITCDRMRSHRMRSRKKTFLSRLSKFLKMHREQEAGQKVCRESFFTTTNCEQISFIIFSPFSKRKKYSFYTAKRFSSVHSCRDETRLAVFSVPFPQNKFRTCFFQGRVLIKRNSKVIWREVSLIPRSMVRTGRHLTKK